jgi:hypothetical protein
MAAPKGPTVNESPIIRTFTFWNSPTGVMCWLLRAVLFCANEHELKSRQTNATMKGVGMGLLVNQ